MSPNPSEPSVPLDPSQPVAVIGVGLIGGSICAALKQRGWTGPVTGVGRSAERLAGAIDSGLIDRAETDLPTAASRNRWLIFCTPVPRIIEQLAEAAPHCGPGTILTDAGSVKTAICAAVSADLPPNVGFVGSHPLAGSERAGYEHADGDLFADRVCVVTPTERTAEEVRDRTVAFWEFLGMTVLQRSPEEHDELLAITSHLPHVVASVLAAGLDADSAPFAATGFRDTTRIAAGDPFLWAGICLANREAILTAIAGFQGRLSEFRNALENRDADRLRRTLEDGKSGRTQLD